VEFFRLAADFVDKDQHDDRTVINLPIAAFISGFVAPEKRHEFFFSIIHGTEIVDMISIAREHNININDFFKK
jgi:hypothetical protein